MGPRLIHTYPERSTYHGWWQGWAPAAFLLVLVGCLVYATGFARQANADVLILRGEVARLQGDLAMKVALIEHGNQERDRLQEEIARLHNIPLPDCPPPIQPRPHPHKRQTPVFSRDSQFSGVER